jgi:hypothetical protein
MKKFFSVLLLLTITSLSEIGAQGVSNSPSRTMTIKFNDGSIQTFNMDGIATVEYADNANTNIFSAYLSKAGTLSSVLSKSHAKEILELNLSGHMDARDFNYIKWYCKRIQTIDLADIVIDAYTGDNGTSEGDNNTYVAHEIPAGAFYYWSTSKNHNYSGMPKNVGMSSLTTITLPERIVSIGKNALTDMPSLESVTIMAPYPPKVHESCFARLPKEAKLYVPKGAKSRYRSADGWAYFKEIVEVDANGNTLMANSPLIGTWKTTHVQGWGKTDNVVETDYLQLNADGSYIHVEKEDSVTYVSKGTWTVSKDKFTLHQKDGEVAGSSFDYEILELQSNKMKVSMWRVTMYMEKVQDNVIKQFIKK